MLRIIHFSIFIVLLCFVGNGFSQDNFLNILFGFNNSNGYGNYVNDIKKLDISFNSKNGYNFGLGLSFKKNDIFYIQPEILFDEKGYILKDQSGSENDSLIHKLTFIEMPVLFKLCYPNIYFKPNIFAGPYVGLTIQSELTDNIKTTDQKKGTSIFDIGVTAGGGIDINFNQYFGIVVQSGYDLGLVNMDNSQTTDMNGNQISDNTESFFNTNLYITTGIKINF